ncbi:homoserine dehydrogenase [Vagococcus carniphilus]|uniref:homoserine dehydrogenase n=1 Tax=Vagococcus carniphilus TaxID=218144 RepID=UPI0028915988|nr:homoserine dehydrogenase [Vagococcus carniphilus]MDT2831458.1 homoserine dehydrogenase [Vagococcus carniphilus]MDT2840180.1 homoserine dehydrogenase [Vagococcus carniphilus]MDT2854997.1 homoserine dehydrogenase [Vagococcus carniphilus]
MMKCLTIGILGLGTVGAGIPLILEENKNKMETLLGMPIKIKKAFVRNIETKQTLAQTYEFELTTSLEEIINDESIDVVVEVMGGTIFAKEAIEQALRNKKHVVTANKDLIAQYGEELVLLAKENQVYLYYEAAVAGGIPILRTLATSLASDDITGLYGIINGTTNFMLSQMVEQELSYEKALDKAQKLGFAESDPTNDVEGIDAAYKMIILTKFALGMPLSLEDISIQGISDVTLEEIKLADELGYKIKLLGALKRDEAGVNVEVCPMGVPKSHPLSTVENEMNAIFVESTGIGESMFYGPGAGAKPTATSIVSDLMTIGKNLKNQAKINQFNELSVEKKLVDKSQVVSKRMFFLQSKSEESQLKSIQLFFEKEGIELQKVTEQVENSTTIYSIITDEMSGFSIKNCQDKISEELSINVLSHYKVL